MQSHAGGSRAPLGLFLICLCLPGMLGYWGPWEQELREKVKVGVFTLLEECVLRSPREVGSAITESGIQRRGQRVKGVAGTKSDPLAAFSSVSFRPLCTEHWGTRGESLPTFGTTFLHQPP